MRVAAVDLGTNTVLLLVAERSAEGTLNAVAERAIVTRLGEGVDRTRRFSATAISRTLTCLEYYATLVRSLGVERVSVVGTSAMRDAAGGEEIQNGIHMLFGVDARVLSGDEEARLAFRGAVSGLAIQGPADVAVFDIGGGSTEVVLGQLEGGDARVAFSASYDVGSVRLTERLVAHDPLSYAECDALRRAAREAFASVPPLREAGFPQEVPIGVAGTMTTLASVSLRLETYDAARVHGHMMQVSDLRQVVRNLASLNLETRKRVPGMQPERADVIVAGGSLALALLERWKVDATRISDRGVRWGVAEELLREQGQPAGFQPVAYKKT
jgi:exopolyphosphatase / guanosine-5'-triphosphate,3'-diphosphate pyrophosphatase